MAVPCGFVVRLVVGVFNLLEVFFGGTLLFRPLKG